MLGNPVYDAPVDIEACYPLAVLNIAKGGRHRTFETAVLGSNRTNRAIRDHERSAKRHGEADIEVARLIEYPEALKTTKPR